MATTKNILILGATSDIAVSLAAKFAAHGWKLILAGRDAEKIKSLYENIGLAGSTAGIYSFDALQVDVHEEFYSTIHVKPDAVLVAFADDGEKKVTDVSVTEIKKVLDTNFTGVASILNIIKKDFEQKKSGAFIVISSVAAERAKAQNYYYGASKAALSYYLEGIRDELENAGIQLLHVKPGFVKTKMVPDHAPPILISTPDVVADDLYKAYLQGTKVLYTPWYWKWIMMVYRNIPQFMVRWTDAKK